MSGLDLNTYYGKISKKARVFNKLDPNQVREGIELAQIDFNKASKDISTVHLEDGNLDIEQVKYKKNREKIEYVVEEEHEQEGLDR